MSLFIIQNSLLMHSKTIQYLHTYQEQQLKTCTSVLKVSPHGLLFTHSASSLQRTPRNNGYSRSRFRPGRYNLQHTAACFLIFYTWESFYMLSQNEGEDAYAIKEVQPLHRSWQNDFFSPIWTLENVLTAFRWLVSGDLRMHWMGESETDCSQPVGGSASMEKKRSQEFRPDGCLGEILYFLYTTECPLLSLSWAELSGTQGCEKHWEIRLKYGYGVKGLQ